MIHCFAVFSSNVRLLADVMYNDNCMSTFVSACGYSICMPACYHWFICDLSKVSCLF